MSTVTRSVTDNPPSETLFHLRQAFKLALSLVLFYWLALTTNWDVPIYGALAISLISLDTTGATIEKGIMRFLGTTVGVFVGLFVLALCSYDRWALMAAFAIYLAIVGYFMQASRYKYAWFVAAFVPLVVWADNYPNFESAFYFGVFRYLETTVGILIYTTVDLVFWPRIAGSQLEEQGVQFWTNARDLIVCIRQKQASENQPNEGSDLQTKITANFNQVTSTLDSAYIDSLDIREQASQWEEWRLHAGRFVDALLTWQAEVNSTQEQSTESSFSGPQIDLIQKRVERLTTLWQQASNNEFVSSREDARLLVPIELDETVTSSEAVQLRSLDEASRELLKIQRELLGWDSHPIADDSPQRENLARLFGWDPKRLFQAMFPPLSFIVGFVFWIWMNPPAGPKVPFFTGNFALILLRTPMNLPSVVVLMLLTIFLVVAPIYWLVMPALSTGVELLSLIFVYSMVFGFVGGRSPAVKTLALLMFFSMTGISNEQSYSFSSMVDGGMMMLLAGIITTGMSSFFKPPSK